MKPQPPCPEPAHLRGLLRGSLSETTQAELTSHVEGCGSCQQKLEELSAEADLHPDMARRLGQGESAPEPALRQALDELKANPSHDATQGGPAESDELSLDFLSPTEQPEHLGRLGHYEVTEVIGRGGMGVVLKAFDEKLQRVVAIKVMAPQLATSATARKRFVREAQAAAAIRNEHVIDIHAVEEANGLPYLVMEYVSGMSLQERLDRAGPLELKEILRIGIQTAAGLAAAHAHGLIHRDIKPANILLENGVERVKITDFGLARAADDSSLTNSGVVAGTPQYMAPEQAEGKPVDHRADLFSLGSVLYALCTGRAPFRASGTMAVLKRVTEDKPQPIEEINADIPDWLVAIITRLHAKDPVERWQSAAEVAALLSQHLAHVQQPTLVPLPIGVARPESSKGVLLPTPFEDSGRATPRRRWAAAAAILLVLAGGLGLTEATGVTKVAATAIRVFTPDGILVVEGDDPNVKVTIEGDGAVVIGGVGQEVRLRPGSYRLQATKDGKLVKQEVVSVARGGKQVVSVSLEPTDPVRAASTFRFQPPPPGPLDKLGAAQIAAAERFPWQPKELVAVLGEHRQRHWGQVLTVAWSKDGKRIASGGQDHVIRIWDAETMRERAVLRGHTREVQSVVFSGDGRRILSGSLDQTVRWWNVETGQQLHRIEASEQVDCVALDPNGRQFLSGGHARLVRLWDLETGHELRRFEGHIHTVGSVAFSPDGRCALSAGCDHMVRLWDVGSGKELRCLEGHTGMVRSVAFSPDGRLALSGNIQTNNSILHASDYDLRLWNLETGQELRRFKGHTNLVEGVTFSPDGHRALSCSEDGTLRWWEVDTGKEVCRFEGHVRGVKCVALSADGHRAVSGGKDGTVRLWDVAAGKELRPVTGPTCPAYQVTFSRDGSQVLAAGGDKVVRLWDIAQANEPRCFTGHTDPVVSVALSPDGSRALSASGGLDPFAAEPANGDRTSGPCRLWDVSTGKQIQRLYGASTEAGSVAFSPDGKRALTGCGFQVLLWDVETGRQLRALDGHRGFVATVAYSPDGRRALSGGWEGALRLWDIASGKELHCFMREHMGGALSAAFSPDGRYAVSGGDLTVRLCDLDVDPPRERYLFKWHTDKIVSVAFGPDGKTVATAGDDGRIVLCDVASGDKLREWQLAGPVKGIAVAPDGRHLASANGNGTVYLLRLAKP